MKFLKKLFKTNTTTPTPSLTEKEHKFERIIGRLSTLKACMSSRLISKNYGTERVTCLGDNLDKSSDILTTLIMTYNQGNSLYITRIKEVTLLELIEVKGTYDLEGKCITRFKNNALLYINTVTKDDHDLTKAEAYYIKVIGNMVSDILRYS